MFVLLNIFYFMDTFLSFLKAKLDDLVEGCRWTAYPPPTPPPVYPLRSAVYLRTEDGASIFAERRNCMMRSCACLLGKEALAYIITHSLSSGGSSPHHHHHHHLSQPVPPSCTSFCLDLPDDLHNNGGPSRSRSVSSADTGLSLFKLNISNLR